MKSTENVSKFNLLEPIREKAGGRRFEHVGWVVANLIVVVIEEESLLPPTDFLRYVSRPRSMLIDKEAPFFAKDLTYDMSTPSPPGKHSAITLSFQLLCWFFCAAALIKLFWQSCWVKVVDV